MCVYICLFPSHTIIAASNTFEAAGVPHFHRLPHICGNPQFYRCTNVCSTHVGTSFKTICIFVNICGVPQFHSSAHVQFHRCWYIWKLYVSFAKEPYKRDNRCWYITAPQMMVHLWNCGTPQMHTNIHIGLK